MRLLRAASHTLPSNEARTTYASEQFFNGTPPYAILSHTWGDEEVTFQELAQGGGLHKAGYDKIRFCVKQAARDGFQYFWIDSCTIDQSNNAELTEAINSMFKWYRNAGKCYVYLADVSSPNAADETTHPSAASWIADFTKSRWFTRGWTLQELIAPTSVEFFSREGKLLGNKVSLADRICDITGIPTDVLKGRSIMQYSVDERMSWAMNRQTKRPEDGAYCLLGIFEVNFPSIYGEGRESAFRRLRNEIVKNFQPVAGQVLGSIQTSIHPLQQQAFSRSKMPSHPIRDHYGSFNLPKTSFIGRNDYFVQIDEAFSRSTTNPATTVLHGMGDQGKTKLAVEYTQRKLAAKLIQAVVFVDASSEDSLKRSLELICDELNPANNIIKDPALRISTTIDILNSWSISWILLLDNYDDPLGFDKLHYHISKFKEALVIVTSRDQNLQRLGTCVPINSLSDTDAISLLFDRSTIPRSDDENKLASAIVTRLGRLALAIDQTGAYLSRRRRKTLRGFLNEYETHEPRILSEVPRAWDYRSNVTDTNSTRICAFTTWEMSLSLLGPTESDRQRKIQFLTICSYLNYADISESILQERCPRENTVHSDFRSEWRGLFIENSKWDHILFEDVILDLFGLSLITECHNDENGHLHFTIHPLIANWLRLRNLWKDNGLLKADSNALVEAILVVQDFLRSKAELIHLQVVYPMEPADKVSILAHIKSCQRRLNTSALLLLGTGVLEEAGERIGVFLGTISMMEEQSLELLNSTLQNRVGRLGSYDRNVILLMARIALSHIAWAKVQRGIGLLQQAVEAAESAEVGDKQLLFVLRSRLFEEQFEITGNKSHLIGAIQAAKEVLVQPSVISTALPYAKAVVSRQMSYLLFRARKLSSAIHFQENYEHGILPANLATMERYSSAVPLLLAKVGIMSKAESITAERLSRAEISFGPESPELFEAKRILLMTLEGNGHCRYRKKRLSLAVELYDFHRRFYGETHRRTMEIQASLSSEYLNSKRLVEAEQHARHGIKILDQNSAKSDIFLARLEENFLNELIEVQWAQNNYMEPIGLQRRNKDLYQKLLGQYNFSTLEACCYYYSYIRRYLEDHNRCHCWQLGAIKIVVEFRTVLKSALSSTHWNGFYSSDLLGMVYEFSSSIGILSPTLNLRWHLYQATKCLDTQDQVHRFSCLCLTSLAEALNGNVRLRSKRMEILKWILGLRLTFLGEDHPLTIQTKSNIAHDLNTSGTNLWDIDKSEGLRLFNKAMAIGTELVEYYQQYHQEVDAVRILEESFFQCVKFNCSKPGSLDEREAVDSSRQIVNRCISLSRQESTTMAAKKWLGQLLESGEMYQIKLNEAEELLEEVNRYENRPKERIAWCNCHADSLSKSTSTIDNDGGWSPDLQAIEDFIDGSSASMSVIMEKVRDKEPFTANTIFECLRSRDEEDQPFPWELDSDEEFDQKLEAFVNRLVSIPPCLEKAPENLLDSI
jgi:Heterokaryon incompatibility protein (HET)